jgi:hypothetical protein
MPRPFQSRFDHPNIWQRVQITELLITQSPCNFVPVSIPYKRDSCWCALLCAYRDDLHVARSAVGDHKRAWAPQATPRHPLLPPVVQGHRLMRGRASCTPVKAHCTAACIAPSWSCAIVKGSALQCCTGTTAWPSAGSVQDSADYVLKSSQLRIWPVSLAFMEPDSSHKPTRELKHGPVGPGYTLIQPVSETKVDISFRLPLGLSRVFFPPITLSDWIFVYQLNPPPSDTRTTVTST